VNTRSIDPSTTWAVLVMEAALALAIISLPTQGDRLTGLAGPLLLLALLPAGCAAIYLLPTLRDPSWRLLTGIGLALLTRAIVQYVPNADPQGLMVWLARAVVPAIIGVGLWWRGGALAVAELTPGDVRTEFSVIAVCLLGTLSFVRPFLLPDPMLLSCSVGLFALGGLIGASLSRQDAADVVAPRLGRPLAIFTSVALPVLAILLVGSLRRELLEGMWLLLAHAIELLLTPIGLLIAWLSSLLPRLAAGPPPPPPPPPPRVVVDPAVAADFQERMAWLGTLIMVTLLAAAGAAAMLAARLLLNNFIRDPQPTDKSLEPDEMAVETSGSPAGEAADLFGWLWRWLRASLGSRRGVARRTAQSSSDEAAVDAWSAYQRLLAWAAEQGLTRRPAETTGQFGSRLSGHSPEASGAVDLVTRAFEWERYGGVSPAGERMRRIREALATLVLRREPR
jgi:hypothetical protein